jgi:hypothetical protein
VARVKTVTLNQIIKFSLCYPKAKIRQLAGGKAKWTALEILARKDIPAKDRLYLVLREKFIDASLLHEFGCRCAEDVLCLIDDPARKAIAKTAISTKRRWVAGKATDKELATAWEAADAAELDAAQDAAQDVAWAATQATALHAAKDAAKCAVLAVALDAAEDAAAAVALDAAEAATLDVELDAYTTARVAAREAQVAQLIKMLEATA